MLDASAVLAVLNGEPGADIVLAALADNPLISAVNLSEVVSKLSDYGFDEAAIRVQLAPLGLTVSDFSDGEAYRSGILRQRTKALGLSLADRACLDLAQTSGLPALTGDRIWAQLDLGIEVSVFR